MREVVRLVVDGWSSTDVRELRCWLRKAISDLKRKGETTKFLITPGGFALGEFPRPWNGRRGWDSNAEALSTLIPFAEQVSGRIVTPGMVRAARGVVKYLTLNVDLRRAESNEHAELIAVIDMANGVPVGWTGKSYPTMCQEKAMVHVTNPDTHLFTLGSDRVVILGCHDLNVFNGRARANQKPGGQRQLRAQALAGRIAAFRPTHIIQHPHGTDTWKSWVQSWRQINRQFPSAYWASAIAYASNGKRRAPLADVLSRLHHEGDAALDIVVTGSKNRDHLQRDYLP